MKSFCLWVISLLLWGTVAFAQKDSLTSCGQDLLTEQLFRTHPELKQFQEQIQTQLQEYNRKVKSGLVKPSGTQAIVTLPVVVHIIHNNGTENISDAQVFTALQHLNEAYANTGYYDPSDGVNTQIQFCLAQRDPNNNPTNGIDRVVSPLTVIDSWNNSALDLTLKNLSRWNPNCYINIWLVKEIVGPVAGYAYLPSAHGMNIDGIVQEAGYFGTSYANDVVAIHEMGHYLGLYHTFQGACKNDDCTKDGDQVCDTPPDQSTAGISCNSTVNSCSTDALSGFSTDVNDLHTDYLDYGNWNCMKVFTQGQADRMNWMIQNVRKSLLACKSCMVPCPTPVLASFNSSSNNISVGASVNFTNTTTNASAYRWYVNGVLQSTALHYTHVFSVAGTYTIKLTALNTNPLCDSAFVTDTVTVTCPVTASFSPGSQSVPINTLLSFVNTSTGASSYQWTINGVPVATTPNYAFNVSPAGFYEVRLTASNGFCKDSSTAYIAVIDTTTGPTDSCNRNIFQKIYSHSTAFLQANSVEPTSGTGAVIAGSIQFSNRQSPQAYAMKVDFAGRIEWASQLSGVDNAQLYKLRQSADGGYIGVGSGANGIWLVKLSSGGNLVWSKHWNSQNNIDEAVDLLELANGNIALVGNSAQAGKSDGIILCTNPLGTILWTVQLKGGDITKFTGLVENNGQLLVTGYTYISASISSISSGVIVSLDKNDGTIYGNTGFQLDSKSNTDTKIFRDGAGYRLSSSISSNLASQEKTLGLLKLDQNLNLRTAHALLKSDFNALTQAGPGKNGSMLAPISSNSSGLLYNIDQDNASPLTWKKSYSPVAGDYSVTNAISNNGYPMIAATLGESTVGSFSKKILLIKTDSAGNTADCITGNPSESIKSVDVSFRTINWTLISTYNFQNKNYQVSSVPTPITVTNLCTTCDSLILPPPDTCKSISFQKRIGGDGNDIATDIKVTPTDEYLVSGTSTIKAGNTDFDAILIKLDKYGQKVWQKSFAGNRNDRVCKVIVLKSGHYLSMGITESLHSSTGSLWIMKLDSSGNTLWQKELHVQAQSISSIIDIAGLIELPDETIAFCGNANGINTDVGQPINTIYNFIGKTDSVGNILWLKRSRYYYWESGYPVKGLIATKSGLMTVIGDGIMKVSQADGSLMGLQKRYTNAGILSSIENNGNTISVYSTSMRLGLDTSANLFKAVKYTSDPIVNSINFNGFSSENGAAMTGTVGPPASVSGTWLTQFSETGVLINSVKLPFVHPKQEAITGLRITKDKGIFGANIKTGDQFYGESDIFLIRTDAQARMADCPRSSQKALAENLNIPYQELIIRNYPINSTSYLLGLTQRSIGLPMETLCNGGCNQLKLTGKDTVCSIRDTIEFKAIRNPGCTALTEWSVDSTKASIVGYTDSTVLIKFKQPGTVLLYAGLQSACRIIMDSLPVHVLIAPDSLNLGPDIQLCKFSTYTLRAGSGFKSYRWQDGSVDSVLTVFEPGKYFVETEDFCGKKLYDTVIITLSAPIPFDLGPDLVKCNNDSVTITAPTGFSQYHWSPNYQTSSINSRIIKVAPLNDTIYRVVADYSPSCVVSDSIKVFVKKSPPVNIGADTAFCEKDTITLQASPGFSSYLWNNLSTSSSLKVYQPGIYTIEATYSNGCVSRDTLLVPNLLSLPTVDLGKDQDLCEGKALTLDAGTQFSYLWDDLSTGRTRSVQVPGLYTVKVSTANGCSTTDSIRINKLKESPKAFLDSTAELCNGQKITIKGKVGFDNYRWYNNSIGTSIEINAPGIYWLEVTNSEGCIVRDSILVKGKDCAKGIFFPNAFTPGNGGKNNIFRPIVYGQLESFSLIIFNRWGQKIFETTNALEGWNGRVGSSDQQTSNFVWMACYKFVGEKEKVDKGVVILIR